MTRQNAPGHPAFNRFPFIEDGGTSKKQGSVYDIGMSDNPADIGCCPVDFTGTDIVNIFHGPGQRYEMSPIIPHHAFGFSRSPEVYRR